MLKRTEPIENPGLSTVETHKLKNYRDLFVIERFVRRLLHTFYLMLAFEIADSNGENNYRLTDDDRLHQELFVRRHYNPNSRPVANANEAVDVEMAIIPIQIAKVDDLNEILKMHIWIEIEWIDLRLAWNESDYGGLKRVVVRHSQIWAPDVTLMNSAQEWKPFAGVNAVVYSNGLCTWYPPLIAASYCPIDVSWFPFDEQHCTMEFESWSYDTSELNLSLKKNSVIKDHYRKNSEWELVETTENATTIKYDCCPHPNSHVRFTHYLRRRTLFYWFNLVLPCSLLSALSAIAFILPPQSEERLGLEISTLLALSVHQLLVADRVPPTSDTIPVMGVYFACIMIMNAASLTLMVVISNIYHRSLSMYPMPKWIKAIICQKLSRFLGLRNRSVNAAKCLNGTSDISNAIDSEASRRKELVALQDINTASSKCETLLIKDEIVNQEDEQEPEVDWKFAAIVIDRLCFCVCTAYIALVTLAFYACVLSVQWL